MTDTITPFKKLPMKKLTFIFFLIAAVVHSQNEKYEKIKALKTAYITEKISLTPSEAEKFWPVYNNFEEKFHKLRHKKHSDAYKQLSSGMENLNDLEANRLIEEFINAETERLTLKKEKIEALRKVISPKKIIGLQKAEDDFKRELLNRYRSGKEKSTENKKRKP